MNENRAKVSIKKLSELNSYVPVNWHEGDLTNEFLATFQVGVSLYVFSFRLLESCCQFI